MVEFRGAKKEVADFEPGTALPSTCTYSEPRDEAYEGVEEANAAFSCRFCLHCTDNVDELISPCSCTGTQKYVHLDCLRRWQNTLLRRGEKQGGTDDRARRCNVCCSRYSVAPVKPPQRADWWACAMYLVATACFLLTFFHLQHSALPYVALVVLILICSRQHMMLVVSALTVALAMIVWWNPPLRLVLRFDGNGWPGMAVIRYGPPVSGLAQGSVLVASKQLGDSAFHQSVVLLTQHNEMGSQGVVLTQNRAPHQGDVMPARHFVGCPTGMPGCFPSKVTALHTHLNLEGAVALLPSGGEGPGLFMGGSADDLAQQAASGSSASVSVYHGLFVWEKGQLAGDIRSGVWGFTSLTADDVLSIPPGQLWSRLSTDDRVKWLVKA